MIINSTISLIVKLMHKIWDTQTLHFHRSALYHIIKWQSLWVFSWGIFLVWRCWVLLTLVVMNTVSLIPYCCYPVLDAMDWIFTCEFHPVLVVGYQYFLSWIPTCESHQVSVVLDTDLWDSSSIGCHGYWPASLIQYWLSWILTCETHPVLVVMDTHLRDSSSIGCITSSHSSIVSSWAKLYPSPAAI